MPRSQFVGPRWTRYDARFVDRFWQKVEQRLPHQCWPWRAGCRQQHGGQPRVKAGGRLRTAIIVAWEIRHQRPFPPWLKPHRLCRNRDCVNPLHCSPERHDGVVYVRRRFCKQGHDQYVAANVRVRRDGEGRVSNVCRVCEHARDRERRRERRQAALVESQRRTAA